MSLNWYVLQVHTNSELAVEKQLNRLIEEGLYPSLKRVYVPKETVVTYRNKKPIERTKALYRGYVFLEIEDFNSKDFVDLRQRVPKVLGFAGDPKSPQIMSKQDIEKVMAHEKRIEGTKRVTNQFEKGDQVFIKEGSFANNYGIVVDYFPQLHKIVVEIEVFGRPTEVDIDSRYVDKVG